MKNQLSIGLTHVAYSLPSKQLTLTDLEHAGRLTSPAAFLRDLGFEDCRVEDGQAALDTLLLQCGRELLACANLESAEVGWLITYSGLEPTHRDRPDANCNPLEQFRYRLSRAQHELNLSHATGLALSQQGCSGLLSSLDLAARLLATSESSAALCLAGDALDARSNREILYNLMSDAGAAVLVQKHADRNRIVNFHQHAAPYFWDTPNHTDELLAAYFPLAQRVISHCLEEAGRTVQDVTWFVPHNVNRRSWTILAQLLGVRETAIWDKNISRVGHTVSCDHAINLRDMERAGVLHPGDLVVLFTFGFGATWSCMLLEH